MHQHKVVEDGNQAGGNQGFQGKALAHKEEGENQQRQVQGHGPEAHRDLGQGVEHGGQTGHAAGGNLIGCGETVVARRIEEGAGYQVQGVQGQLPAFAFFLDCHIMCLQVSPGEIGAAERENPKGQRSTFSSSRSISRHPGSTIGPAAAFSSVKEAGPFSARRLS